MIALERTDRLFIFKTVGIAMCFFAFAEIPYSFFI